MVFLKTFDGLWGGGGGGGEGYVATNWALFIDHPSVDHSWLLFVNRNWLNLLMLV